MLSVVFPKRRLCTFRWLIFCGLTAALFSLPEWRLASLPVFAQTIAGIRFVQEPQRPVQEKQFSLELGKPIEQDIANGQVHAYSIRLSAGQFLRVTVEQLSIELELTLAGQDGKTLVEVNLTGFGGRETLSYEAATADEFRLLLRLGATSPPKGRYRLLAETKPAAIEQDQRRLIAERLMGEARLLIQQRAKTAESVIEKHQQALAIWRDLGDSYWAAHALDQIAFAHLTLNRSEQATAYFEQALALHREVRNRAGEGGTLSNLGVANFRLSRFEKAAACYEQSLVIRREIKDQAGEARLLNDLGTVNHSLAKYEKAVEYYEQAMVVRRILKDRLGEGITLSNLGSANQLIGRYEKAIDYYTQALVIHREMKNRAYEGVALNNLAEVYELLGHGEKAIEYFEKALAIAREVKNRYSEGIRLSNLGNAHRTLRRDGKAIELLQQALAIHREGKHRADEGLTLVRLGKAYDALGQSEKAIEHYLTALGIAGEINSPADEAAALYQLANAERARGNPVQSQSYVERSLRIGESVRSGLVSPESRAAFFATVQNAYKLYIDLLMRRHRADPTKGFDALAVETSERARARGLLEMLAESRDEMRRGVDAALIERERTLARQFNEKAQSLNQPNSPARLAALKQELAAIENDYEQVQAAIRKSSPRYGSRAEPPSFSLAELRRELEPGTLLLEYSLDEERSFLWAVTHDSLDSYELPGRERIERPAAEVARLAGRGRGSAVLQHSPSRIGQDESGLSFAAEQLSRLLLAPVADRLTGQRLIVVADGALQYIPFGLLPIPKAESDAGTNPQSLAGKRIRILPVPVPLIVEHEIITLPSLSTLAVQRRELTQRRPAPKTLAVFADPVFSANDSRAKSAAVVSKNSQSPPTTRIIEHAAKDSLAAKTKQGMLVPRLPFTRQEAERILAFVSAGDSLAALDFNANRTAAISPEIGKYRYIHFATHGYLDSEQPGLSGLVLSLVDEQGRSQDGFLRAHEIYGLNLPADLVVLSACRTGLGKIIKGEGVMGLTRGFLYAGAARVIVSLWNVNDRATAALMARFYQKMLKQEQTPAAALRAAQIEMRKQKQWQSPYFWAAFVLQGEWQ